MIQQPLQPLPPRMPERLAVTRLHGIPGAGGIYRSPITRLRRRLAHRISLRPKQAFDPGANAILTRYDGRAGRVTFGRGFVAHPAGSVGEIPHDLNHCPGKANPHNPAKTMSPNGPEQPEQAWAKRRGCTGGPLMGGRPGSARPIPVLRVRLLATHQPLRIKASCN